MSVALSRKVTPSGSSISRASLNSSSAACTLAARPITLSARQFAFFNQTNFPPPKNGSVCNASIVDLIRPTACSALSAHPSIISNPKSPASGGVSLLASSAATRFTSLSSEPTTAWMFAVAVFVFALGIAAFSHELIMFTRPSWARRLLRSG